MVPKSNQKNVIGLWNKSVNKQSDSKPITKTHKFKYNCNIDKNLIKKHELKWSKEASCLQFGVA